MGLRELISSDQRRHRILRHSLFWATWWAYLSFTKWYDQQPHGMNQYIPSLGDHIPVKTLMLLCMQAMACYFFLYVLLPVYMKGQKLMLLALGMVCSTVFLLAASYIIHWKLFPLLEKLLTGAFPEPGSHLFWVSVSNGLLNAPKIIASATGISLIKYWGRKQKEKERLEKEYVETELQLLKGQLRPAFLMNALERTQSLSETGSERTPEMLLRLSDLLSYILYECETTHVPLEREVHMMMEYLSMEKSRYEGGIEMEVTVKGELAQGSIAPLLLLPFIDNGFRHCSTMREMAWMTVDFGMEGSLFSMKIIHGASPGIDADPSSPDPEISNVIKRLTLIYPGLHELRMGQEQEMFMTHLKIWLSEPGPSYPAQQHTMSGTLNVNDQSTAHAQ
jgi:two-component system LytT family sensor kinase